VFNVTGQPFTIARRFAIAERPNHPAHVNLSLRNTVPLKRGDYLLVTYYARGKKRPERVDDGRGALVQPFIKGPGTNNHVTNYHNITEIHEEWDRYWFKRADPLDRDYAVGELELLFMVGNKAQDVEIGGLALMAFPAGSDATKLPRRTWTYAGREADAPWRKEAAARIDKVRKSNLVVNVVDAAGKPVPMRRCESRRKNMASSLARQSPAQPFSGRIEPRRRMSSVTDDSGKVLQCSGDGERLEVEVVRRRAVQSSSRRKPRDAALAQRARLLAARPCSGVAELASHARCPAAVAQGNRARPGGQEKLRAAVREHVTDTVTRYKGLIDDWDVTNETEGNRDYMDLLGIDEMTEWYKLARAADPKVQLTFTEPNFGPGGMEGGSFP
jgi:hypothetical protein